MPTPEQQVEFLGNLQRLLAEGSFVATYKHALLLALADFCVERGDDTGCAFVVPVPALAEKIVTYYWRQARPYPANPGTEALKQNTGRQASIVRLVAAELEANAGAFAAARAQTQAWGRLVADVAAIVKKMPLWKLQRVGDEVLDFIYPNVGHGNVVELRPGVAFCFRRFHGLVEELVRGSWLRFVRGINEPITGHVANLDEFLFGSERENLSKYREILSEIQGGRCFYCDNRLNDVAVDHFIPWSRYPIDLGHNFVLADSVCNRRKGDRIACLRHLQRWVRRNENHADYLSQSFQAGGLFADRRTSMQVTRWAYAQVEVAKGLVWQEGESLVPLHGDWREVLGVAV